LPRDKLALCKELIGQLDSYDSEGRGSSQPSEFCSRKICVERCVCWPQMTPYHSFCCCQHELHRRHYHATATANLTQPHRSHCHRPHRPTASAEASALARGTSFAARDDVHLVAETRSFMPNVPGYLVSFLWTFRMAWEMFLRLGNCFPTKCCRVVF
jgi:hypothetical protein